MRLIFFLLPYLNPILIPAQSNIQKGEIAIKWDPLRLVNPFNSTIQVGVEYGITESLSVQSDVGANSNIFNSTYYNKSIFIIHNQLKKFKRHGHFYGLDLFYMHAKDYSSFRCLYDKNKKISSDYDSVMLIKNAPGIAVIAGRQLIFGNVTVDLFFGGGLRLITNKPEYKTQTIHPPNWECATTHFAWHNDKYSGTFAAGHISLGIKLGYLLNRKRTD
jgi:hypothetical protein